MDEPLTNRVASVAPPEVRLDENRFVDEAVVAKRFVVVAEVPVAFTKVKF